MSQFVVPQFIDVEDKIIGSVTTRQFLILLATALTGLVVYRLASFWVMLGINIPLLVGGLVLSFVKVNGQPFHFFLLNIMQTWRRPRIRTWNKELTDAELIALTKVTPIPPPAPKPYKEAPTTSRLSELALVVNTGGVYQPED